MIYFQLIMLYLQIQPSKVELSSAKIKELRANFKLHNSSIQSNCVKPASFSKRCAFCAEKKNNPLSAECLAYLTWKFDFFLWPWTLGRVPRSFATHASLCFALPLYNLKLKLVIFRHLNG